VHSMRSGDLVQGMLQDSWFLGALAIVASRQDLLLDLIVSDELGEAGLFTFRFYKNGQWHDMVVDDLLPCHPESVEPLFAHSAQEGELWPALMEKAYAKLHGSFYSLDGGNCAEALVDLTGGASLKIKFHDPKYKEEVYTGKLWARMRRYNEWGYLMGCSYKSHDPTAYEDESPEGVLWSRAYSLLDVQETSNGKRLLRLRNPWGKKEWRGAWSDGSKEWSMPENGGLQQELEYEFLDDGTFWMEYQDFTREFSKLYVCRLFPPSWHQLTIKGAWVGKTAGGAPLQKDRQSSTWCNNPQYHLTVGKQCDMVISLMQRDSRVAFGQRLPKHERHLLIGITVLRVPRVFRGRKWTRLDAELVRETPLSPSREVTISVTLDAHSSYIVVPYTAIPEQEGPFILRTFSSAPVEVERPPPAHEVQVQGRWTDTSCGGRQPSINFGSNPQFVLEVPRKTSAMLVLERLDTGDKVGALEPEFNTDLSIGLALVTPERDADGAVCRRLAVNKDTDIYVESSFNDMQEAIVFATLVPETPYLVIPSCATPGALMAPFQLTVYSSTDMVLSAFREVQSFSLPGSWAETSAGGCDLHDSWGANPRFLLTIIDSGLFRVALSQPGKKWFRNTPLENMIGFYVLKASRPDGTVAMEKSSIVGETPFVPMVEVVDEIQLQTQLSEAYVIIPCTYAPNRMGDFKISVTSEAPFTLDEL